MSVNDFNYRLGEKIDDTINALKITIDNIKRYIKDADKLELDYELVNMLKDRKKRLESKLEYFRFVSGAMSEKEGDEYIESLKTEGGEGDHKGMLGDLRDYDNVTIIKHNIEYAEEWIRDVDKIIIWINRGKSQLPTEEERENDKFFDFEIKGDENVINELGETIDIQINTTYMNMDKVAEYFSSKIEKKFAINENKMYINSIAFKKVQPFVDKFSKQNFIKYI